MRILLPTPDFPPAKGGIQLLLHRLAERLPAHDLDIVTLAAPGDEAVDGALPARVQRVARSRDHRLSIASLNVATVRAALRLRPDLILSGHIVVGAAALATGRVVGAPVVQYAYAKELGARAQLARAALRRAVATIAVSRHTADGARRLGAPAERVHVIHPGVDPAPAPARAPASRSDRPTILTVARLVDRYKGFDVLLRALPLIRARVPDVRWAVIGDGPLRAELEATASLWGLADTVVFAGSVSDEERDRWLERSHAFAMLSRVPPGAISGEGFGIVYLEAGRAGLPVVAGNEGGAVDAVIDQRTGLLVDPEDHVAAAGALTDLLMDPARAAELGEAGREHAAAMSWDRMAEQVERVLRHVAAQSR